jgi:hypothetical protein
MRRAATASSVHVLTLPTHHGRSHSRREAAVQRLLSVITALQAHGLCRIAGIEQERLGAPPRRQLEPMVPTPA